MPETVPVLLPLRLAVSLNGAVSLGAYEAGVLAQVYADVWEMNTDSQRVVIDAISGASAGSVVGALLAQALTTSQPPESFAASLQDVWIDGLNIVDLLGDTSNSANSLFDPKTLTNLAGKVLTGKPDAPIPPVRPSHPIALSIAMTNLEGIPYAVKPGVGPNIIGYLYADYEPYLVDGGQPYHLPAIENLTTVAPGKLGAPRPWSDVALKATVSGSFPVAFKTHSLQRDLKADYPGYVALGAGFPETAFMNYTDGGVLNNEPIGRAIDATSYLRQYLNDPTLKWTFLVIEPAPTSSQDAIKAVEAANDAASKGAEDPGLPFVVLTELLLQTLINDALYRDLAQVAKTNDHLGAIKAHAAANGLDEAAHQSLKRAVGLGGKTPINIERVSALNTTLYGAFLGHFGGFLYKPYRQQDFFTGAQQARAWAIEWANKVSLPVPTGQLIAAPPTDLVGGGGALNIPAADRKVFESKFIDRIETLFHKQFGFPNWLIMPISALNGLFRKWLDDRLS